MRVVLGHVVDGQVEVPGITCTPGGQGHPGLRETGARRRALEGVPGLAAASS